jgi:hypothetical protein
MMPSNPLVKAVFHLSWLLTVLCFLSSSALAQTCVQPPAGLVSWSPGDEDAQDIIGPNDGTLHGDATFAPGMVGQAFSFDGDSDYVAIPDAASFNALTSAITIDAWIRVSSFPDPHSTIISKGDTSWRLQRVGDSNTIRFGPKGAQEVHNKGHIEDVNHDGEPDLLLHFQTQATGITCGDTSASLTGETFDGDPIQGSDAIQTVGCQQ